MVNVYNTYMFCNYNEIFHPLALVWFWKWKTTQSRWYKHSLLQNQGTNCSESCLTCVCFIFGPGNRFCCFWFSNCLSFSFLREETDAVSIVWPQGLRAMCTFPCPAPRCVQWPVVAVVVFTSILFGNCCSLSPIVWHGLFFSCSTFGVGLYPRSGSLPWWWLIWGMDTTEAWMNGDLLWDLISGYWEKETHPVSFR